MGLYKKGILGHFRGKVGTVVGAVWKGIAYMRSLPDRSSSARPTQAQLNVQQKLALAVDFLSKIKTLIQTGYQKFTDGISPFNAAVSHLLKHAITGAAPNFAINYPNLVLSVGDLEELETLALASTEPAEVTFTWTPNLGMETGQLTDKVTIVGFCPENGKFVKALNVAERSTLTYTLSVPVNFSAEQVHFWVILTSADGKEVSNSTYMGLISIL